MFPYMEGLGIKVPKFGLVKDVVPQIRPPDDAETFVGWRPRVVVYLDERAHRGEGKVVSSGHYALKRFPDHFCTEYVGTFENGAKSLRYLQIGAKCFYLTYESDDQWRSNVGNVRIEASTPLDAYYRWEPNPYPLRAIDFVRGADGEHYAVDFNIAPEIKGTGIEEFLDGPEVVALIEDWQRNWNENRH
jgi:hypothetical protein